MYKAPPSCSVAGVQALHRKQMIVVMIIFFLCSSNKYINVEPLSIPLVFTLGES